MKTWNEIENRLRSENSDGEFPPDLHDRIMRSVRDDRAASSIASSGHRPVLAWLLAGASVVACAIAITTKIQRPAAKTDSIAIAPSPPEISFASIEAIATAPMNNEVANLETDIASAAKFLVDCLPESSSGT